MRSALLAFLPNLDLRRQRVVAFVVVLGIHLALLSALILLGRVRIEAPTKTAPITITFLPDVAPTPPAAEIVRAEPTPSRLRPAAAPRAAAPSTAITEPGIKPLDIDFDLAKVPATPAEQLAEAAPPADTAAASGPVYGPVLTRRRGGPPPGETLYPVEWAREPTRAELITYLPESGAREGNWGIIACRTVAALRVEDCTEIEESQGSGISRSLRRAAWQFRVRPPRINGRAQIGTWVRIRIDFTQDGLK